MRPLRAIDIHFYTICEGATGIVLCLMIVFSPWAFGTTQPWSKWTMNVAGYLLGLLLLAKLAVRYLRGYKPARWDTPPLSGSTRSCASLTNLTRALALLSVFLLLYCFVSAVNARATFIPSALTFEYHSSIRWLPHSFDSSRSWFAFWSYLALACSFWAARDWLLGKSTVEQRTSPQNASVSLAPKPTRPLSDRLQWLLWLLAINGLLLALEGIVQRVEGSGKLLFAVTPRVNPNAVAQFGPWAYRANAASYFNLLWPVCLGFWWTLHRSRTGTAHHVLLLCATAMAACPLVTASRGGAIVTLAILMAASALLLLIELPFTRGGDEHPESRTRGVLLMPLFVAATLGLGLWLGWKYLEPRVPGFWDNFHAREAMYDTARPMARDYPLFGTGPGTFATVFQLYRVSTETYWPAQLHNDWLETRITFGWLGSAMIFSALLIVLVRCFLPSGIYADRRLVLLTCLALAGCLLHARWDFPFQIYSILFLFLVLCAVVFTVSCRVAGWQKGETRNH